MTNTRTVDRAFSLVGLELQTWARHRYNELLDQMTTIPRSQIEEALMIGMVGLNVFNPFFEFDGAISPNPRFSHALVKTQHRIGIYTADFLIESWVGSKLAGATVIECDGDYHLQSRQRAKDNLRDAFMTEKGYGVLRFTGKEIWENPITPALKIVAACEDLIRSVAKPVDKPVDEKSGPIHPQPSTGDPAFIHEENRALLLRVKEDFSS